MGKDAFVYGFGSDVFSVLSNPQVLSALVAERGSKSSLDSLVSGLISCTQTRQTHLTSWSKTSLLTGCRDGSLVHEMNYSLRGLSNPVSFAHDQLNVRPSVAVQEGLAGGSVQWNMSSGCLLCSQSSC